MLAFVQDDIKKVLAYSTISQLGYMVMALGVGAWVAAVFHLFTHAFFKALLFLGAGSVSHSGSHHSFDMKKDMGGLRKYMPITFWTFMIGSLALAGIFPLAGFWSKDEILVTAGQSRLRRRSWSIGLVGAFLTAAYMTRCVYLTFFGEYRGHGHPHESPNGDHRPAHRPRGVLGPRRLPQRRRRPRREVRRVGRAPACRSPSSCTPSSTTRRRSSRCRSRRSASASPRSSGSSARSWARSRASRSATSSRTPGYTFLENKYYLDDLYENVIVAAIKGAIADGVVLGQPARHRRRRQRRRARAPGSSGKFTYETLDQKGVDGAVNGVAEITGESGGLLRYLQSGRVQRYALLLFGAVGLLEPLPATRQHPDSRGIVPMDWFDDWALTLAVFIPLVGMAIVLLIPQAEETSIKVVALLTTLADRRGRHRDPRRLRLRRPATLQFQANEPWIDGHQQPLPPRHRRHLAAAGAPHDAGRRSAASSTPGTTSPSRTTRRRSSR